MQEEFQGICYSYFSPPPPVTPVDDVLLQTDTSPVGKAHSPTLPERGYIAVPNNVIPGNKPLDIGYDISFINLSEPSTKWSLPLSVGRVGKNETASQKALDQIGDLLSHPDLGLSGQLVVNTLDSKYGNAAYLAPAFKHDNLVNIVRMRSGIKVWSQDRRSATGGTPNIYGEKFYLVARSGMKAYKRHPKTGLPYSVYRQSVYDLQKDEILELTGKTRGGRDIVVEISRWNNMMIRSKGGNKMKDKPIDLLGIKVRDSKTGKSVFNDDMFVAISGRRKEEIPTRQGYQDYRHRYDIEPSFRFAKQKLFLDKFQTPCIQHFDNYLLVIMITMWLLYTASDEATFVPRKWRKYTKENKHARDQYRLTIAQTRHAAQSLFSTFDPTPFLPKRSKKGRPRQKGQTQVKRKRYPVVKKHSKSPRDELETEK